MALDLRPAKLDIDAIVGNDITIVATVTDSAGAAVDLSAYTIQADVYAAGVSVATFGDSVGGASSNVITLTLTDTQTTTLGADSSSRDWSLKVTNAGDTREWLAGRFRLYTVGAAGNTTTTAVALTVGSVSVSLSALGATGLDAHLTDTTDAHDASAISFTPTGTIAATDVQTAIAEVASEGGAGAAAWGGITGTLTDQTDLNTALGLKAPLANPTFTGTPAAPTAAPGTNTTQVSTTAFVQAAVAALIDAAPGALDTINELAAAIGDDANFATTVANALAAHASDTTSIHGIADTSALETTTGAQTKADAAEAAAIAASQPLNTANLTAIAALTTTAYGRAVLELADQAALMALLSAASDTAAGKVELATSAEVATGTDPDRAVTPAGAASHYAPKARTISTEAGATYTLAAGDLYLWKEFTDTSPEVTVPDDGDVTWPVGGWVEIFATAGPITFIEDTSVTILKATGQSLVGEDAGSGFFLIKVAAQTWRLVGRLAAA